MDVTQYRNLGQRGLKTTLASMGGGGFGNFGRLLTNADAEALYTAAWEAGIRYFDTAPFYGRGRSERRLGPLLQDQPRDSFVLSTKVGRLMAPARGNLEEDGLFKNLAPFNQVYDYTYDGVMRSYEDSLQRLGMDRIDLLYVHDIGTILHGDQAPARLKDLKEGGIQALEELRNNGNISGYGLGVIDIDACLDCLDYADPDAFLLAARFTLLDQCDALPLLDRCAQRHVSVVIGGVFNSGILATGAKPDSRYNYGTPTPEILDLVRRYELTCEDHGVALSAAALQFPFVHPAVASVLIGAGTVSSLERCMAGLESDIPAVFWQDLADEGLLDRNLVPKGPA